MKLGSGEQIKAKGRGKAGRETVKRHDQSGSVQWASIACQALFPGQTPMRARSSGQDVAGTIGGTGDGEGLAQIAQDHHFATDDLEPGAPDATAWPVAPEHWPRCGGWSTASGGGETEEEERSIGHNTALTRGLSVVLLS